MLLPHLRDRPFTLRQHFTVTRGPYRCGEGMHVLVPIAGRHTHAEARSFANVVDGALRLDRATIDAKMIGHGQQVVAGYSVRPLSYAPVATPLRWEEVTPRLDPREHNLRTLPARVAELADIHAAVVRGRQLLAIRMRLRNNS